MHNLCPGSPLLTPCLTPPLQDIAMAIAMANSLKEQTRMEGELAELNQVCTGLVDWVWGCVEWV